jgi:uncharacterized protein (TIGR03086 family)
MASVDMLQRTLEGASAMVAKVRPDDLNKTTPCTEWDVNALVQHMIDVCQRFGGAITSGASAQRTTSTPQAEGEPAAAYTDAAARLIDGFRTPGAMECTLKLPFGEMPASVAINVALADQLLHTWDLAKAIGQPYTMDADLAEATLRMMQQMMKPEFRGPGKGFGAEVPCPPDAPIQDRVLAFSGRKP